MRHTHFISTAVIIALAFVATPSIAGKGRGRGMGYGSGDGAPGFKGDRFERRGERGLRWLKHLDLTAEQKTRIDALKADSGKTTEPLLEEVRTLRQQMRAAWQADSPNEGTLLSLHRRIHEIQGKLAEERIQLRLDILAVLTPAQRAEIKSLRAQRGKHRGGKGRKN